jgi:hypothetical protein
MASVVRQHIAEIAEIRNGPLLLRSGCADAVLCALQESERVAYIVNDCSRFVDRFELRTSERDIVVVKRPLMRCRITLSEFVAFPISMSQPERPAPNKVVVDAIADVAPLTPLVPRRTEPKSDHGRQLSTLQQSKRQRRRLQGKSK